MAGGPTLDLHHQAPHIDRHQQRQHPGESRCWPQGPSQQRAEARKDSKARGAEALGRTEASSLDAAPASLTHAAVLRRDLLRHVEERRLSALQRHAASLKDADALKHAEV